MNLTSKHTLSTGPIKLRRTDAPARIDLGDVYIQAYYSSVKVRVDKKYSDRVFNSGDAIEYRITGSDGEVDSEAKGGGGVNREEGSITLALPYGTWKIEMRTAKMKWATVANRITLSEATETVVYFPAY